MHPLRYASGCLILLLVPRSLFCVPCSAFQHVSSPFVNFHSFHWFSCTAVWSGQNKFDSTMKWFYHRRVHLEIYPSMCGVEFIWNAEHWFGFYCIDTPPLSERRLPYEGPLLFWDPRLSHLLFLGNSSHQRDCNVPPGIPLLRPC